MTLDELHRIRNIDRPATHWHEQFPKVCCPHCRADVTKSSVIVCSRHCEHCGSRVVDPDLEGDEPTPEEVLALPTVDEYINETRPYRLFMRWGPRGLICVLLAGIIMLCAILSYVPGGVQEWLAAVMFGWLCVGIPLLLVVGLVLVKTRSGWNPKLFCPQCQEADVEGSEKIISSRCCAKCGVRQLLENPVTEVTTTTLYSLVSFIERRKHHDRVKRIINIAFILTAVTSVLLLACIAFYITISTDSIIIVVLVQYGIALLIDAAHNYQVHALRCNHCRGRLRNHAIIIATKHCYHCGERVIAEPEPLPPEIAHDGG